MNHNVAKWIASAVLFIAAVLFIKWAIGPMYSGPTRSGTFRGELLGMQAGYEAYKADFHAEPPTQNPDFFDALDGKNTLNKFYFRLGRVNRDSEGKILDPWGQPFDIKILDGKVKADARGYYLYPDR